MKSKETKFGAEGPVSMKGKETTPDPSGVNRMKIF